MSNILITNNEYVNDKFKSKMEIMFLEGKSYMDVLYFVRDKIHDGHRLLTHPLSGSVKPNETPYKTVMISKTTGELDADGLSIAEESILTARKFMTDKKTPDWTESVLDDFRVIDLSLIENVIDKLGHF